MHIHFAVDSASIERNMLKDCLAACDARSLPKVQELPLELFKLTKLKYLYLFSNAITILPAQIGELTDLMELDLGHRWAHFTRLPAPHIPFRRDSMILHTIQ